MPNLILKVPITDRGEQSLSHSESVYACLLIINDFFLPNLRFLTSTRLNSNIHLFNGKHNTLTQLKMRALLPKWFRLPHITYVCYNIHSEMCSHDSSLLNSTKHARVQISRIQITCWLIKRRKNLADDNESRRKTKRHRLTEAQME